MTEALDFKNFDLVSYIQGLEHPTSEVRVSFNEKAYLDLLELHKRREAASGDERDELDEKMKKLTEEIEASSLSFKLQAVPSGIQRDIERTVANDFPVKKDVFGREEAPPEADDAHTLRMWMACIREVTPPGGTPSPVDDKGVEALFKQAPLYVQEKLNRGIAELQQGARLGVEVAAQEADFLSSASTEG